MYECETCTRAFYSQSACNQHMNDTNHWAPVYECETCTREFSSEHAVNQHMNALGHRKPKVPCETCNIKFYTQGQADKHMKANGHYKNYCGACDIRFSSPNALKMHLNSKVHRGSNVSCPFCKGAYTSASGVSHHLERGACPRAPNLNRESILRAVRDRDPHGVITNRQIEWHGESSVEYLATDHAYNGSFWECYICHRQFNSKGALTSHVNSPAHQQKVYRCPNSKGKCGKQFTTLAALFNHLESESCAFLRFENVQRHVSGMFQGNRSIAF
ncbi:conserved hypothetical protein [Histoplasma capsulatum var. duboisii H88]|uniref:Zinc-finger double-stranded RNA-binding domain-containing protein n=1 Tax=Ajellomyces capsulatus (strain H88) TaxID=544711 RepID=F0USW1_AJEC8|nr:conserved hypothetical protein [Histoplasma capsulatum var. duboisii H88]QSS54585.1 zinc-finger double-stranded RNA-binding domain-containing protein [Histoplasma capsulatum var. duboisii H88]